jgi:hypothetical protein
MGAGSNDRLDRVASTAEAPTSGVDDVARTVARPSPRGPVLRIVAGLVLLGALIGVASLLPIGPALQNLATRPWSIADALVVVAIALGIIAVAAGTAFPTTYVPALWAIAPLIPGLAAVTVVGTDLVAPDTTGPGTRFFVGVEIAAAIAILGAIPLRILATVRVAQTRSYWELRRRSEQLVERLRVIEESSPPSSTSQKLALAEAGEQLREVRRALFAHPRESLTNGLEWVSAMGYVSLWRRIDRADEALIELEPIEMVVAEALHDQLRLTRSEIKRDELMVALVGAVKVIDNSSYQRYFTHGAEAQPSDSSTSTNDGPPDVATARAVLREVRHAVNGYFEDKSESIVRARNRLWRAILLTATTTFLLVGLAVLMNVQKEQLLAASVFFLVAAIVGTFNRLRLQAKADSAVEDFNLFEARLVHTPLISGLAGVAGVFLIAVAPAATSQSLTDVHLSGIFDLDRNLLGIVVAAAFGLAPDRIIGSLHDQTERLKSQLKAGQAAVDSAPDSSTDSSTGDAQATA